MSDDTIKQLILNAPLLMTAFGTLVVSILTAVMTLLNRRSQLRGEEKIDKAVEAATTTREDVETIKHQTNGMHSAIVKLTGESEHAAGRAQGIKETEAKQSETPTTQKE